MALNITVDPSGLTTPQREALAGFILAYPGVGAASHVRPEIVDSEVAILAAEHKADMAQPVSAPEQAFGVPGAAPKLAPFAHFTAVAEASTTAQEAQPVTSAAPSVPAPPAPPSASGTAPAAADPLNPVTLDKHGLPWDKRIHSESKAMNADQTWRRRKNLDPNTLHAVEIELRQTMAAPAAPVVPAPPQAPAAPVVQDQYLTGITANGAQTIVSAEAALNPFAGLNPETGEPLTAPPAPAVDPKQAFVSLVGKASAALQAGKLTQEEITKACVSVGVPALPMLATRLDLVPIVDAKLYNIITSRA